MDNLTRLVATDRSGWYARTPATEYVYEGPVNTGEVYLVDEEKKEITPPGKTEPVAVGAIMVREYPEPYKGFFCLDYVRCGDFIQQSIAFLRKEDNPSHEQS